MQKKTSKRRGSYWSGKHLSEEHKKKLSEAHKGKRLSEETKRKIAEGKKGKKEKKEYDKEYYEKNKEKLKKYGRKHYKKYRKEHLEAYRQSRREYYQKNKDKIKRHKNTPQRKYNKYKWNAERRGIDFNLTFEQFKSFWQKSCCYCGSEIEAIGLDRVKNNIGYTIDNVAPCCGTCNRMKMKETVNDFLEHCNKITYYNK